MVNAAVLAFLIVGCSSLRTQIPKKEAKKAKPAAKPAGEPKPSPTAKLINGVQYSLKVQDQAISNKKRSKEEMMQMVKDHYSGDQKDVGPIDDYLEMWFVNMKTAKDRRQCMDRQLSDMGMKGHIFAPATFKQCIAEKNEDIVKCLINTNNGDCVKAGVQSQSLATHGSKNADALEQAYHIVSNACSHKRMMEKIVKDHKQNDRKAKYAVLLEDDVAFDRHDFVRKVVNFIEKYDGKFNTTWEMVQIDPFGSKCDKHIVGYFEGLPVWKPANVNNDWECSNYWGAQALLVKIDALPKIIKHMESRPTVPLDWLPAELDHTLALHANIAKNPEMVSQYYGGEVHRQWVQYPDYCKKTIKESTIG